MPGVIYHPETRHRRSIRLKGYDYTSAGTYFVTLCTWQRHCLFGDVVDGEICLNSCGELVHREWLKTAAVRNNVAIDEFIVMPNHLHGILVIHDARATQRVAPTSGPPFGSIGAIIGQFKSVVSKRLNHLRSNPGGPIWQRNYYERVIRGDKELTALRQYILNNPSQWNTDKNNPQNL
jgi:REP element-mobilizing transposase RayT